jgi:hypothetical protein
MCTCHYDEGKLIKCGGHKAGDLRPLNSHELLIKRVQVLERAVKVLEGVIMKGSK